MVLCVSCSICLVASLPPKFEKERGNLSLSIIGRFSREWLAKTFSIVFQLIWEQNSLLAISKKKGLSSLAVDSQPFFMKLGWQQWWLFIAANLNMNSKELGDFNKLEKNDVFEFKFELEEIDWFN